MPAIGMLGFRNASMIEYPDASHGSRIARSERGERLDRSKGRQEQTVTRLLAKAKELAECSESDQRTRLNAQVARAMRDTGQDAAFGDYVSNSLAILHAELESRQQVDPDWLARVEDEKARRESIESSAKKLLLSNRISEAEAVYLSAEELRDKHRQWGRLGARDAFLHWMIDDNRVQAALDLFATTDWDSLGGMGQRSHTAGWLAEAIARLGRRDEALRFLRGIWPKAQDPNSHTDIFRIGHAMWRMAAKADAIQAFREAAIGSLREATRDPKFRSRAS